MASAKVPYGWPKIEEALVLASVKIVRKVFSFSVPCCSLCGKLNMPPGNLEDRMPQLLNLLAVLCFGASVCVAANPVPWGACKTVPQMAHPKLLGTIDGHRVYDSVAFRGPRLMSYAETYKKQLPDQPWIKRVFVERNPDEFCEIYRISNEEDNFDYSPTKIVLISGRPAIASLCNLVTNHGPFEQRYFFLNKDGRAA